MFNLNSTTKLKLRVKNRFEIKNATFIHAVLQFIHAKALGIIQPFAFSWLSFNLTPLCKHKNINFSLAGLGNGSDFRIRRPELVCDEDQQMSAVSCCNLQFAKGSNDTTKIEKRTKLSERQLFLHYCPLITTSFDCLREHRSHKHGCHPPTKIMLKVILTSLGGMGVMANLALMAIILIKRPLRR